MARKEYACFSCDTHFTIKTESGEPVKFCPFCGEDLEIEDGNDFEDEDE